MVTAERFPKSTAHNEGGSLHHRLREATQSIHNQIHELPCFDSLDSGQVHLYEYHHILRAHYRFYSAMENHFAHIDGKFPYEIDVIRRLKKDIAGEGIICNATSALQQPTFEPNFAAYLGFSYVKLGSLMGALVVGNALAKSTQLLDCQFYYFSIDQELASTLWNLFLMDLRANALLTDHDEVCASAVHCFSVIYKLLKSA